MTQTSSRKKDHVDICVNEDVAFVEKTTGFERWEFEHNALPEIDFAEVNPETTFLGKHLSFPLMITGMTGGYEDALRINAQLAETCEEIGLALGAGSQRQALEDTSYHKTWRILRERAPHIPIIANLGAAEVARLKDVSLVLPLLEMLKADAIAVHLNPLQEFLQPEGNPAFRGVLKGLELLVRSLPVPVMVKEIGTGISPAVARRLFDAGIRIIDVSGAGGTSWADVEMRRREDGIPVSSEFREWGIATAEALTAVHAMQPADAVLIASGGITDGVVIAKALALGAHLAGSARPLLRTLLHSGPDSLRQMLLGWKNDLRGVMFLTGSRTIDHLRRTPLKLKQTTSA